MKFRLASQSLKIVLLSTLCLTGCGRLGYDSFGRDAGAAIDMRVTDLGFDGGAPDMFDLGNVGDGAPADLGLDAGLAQTPGIVVMPTEGLVTIEMGGADTFTIVLSSRPSFDVQVMLSSSDPGEGTVSPSSVTFSSINWNAPQLVTITGQDDALTDGDVDYSIVTSDAMSVDPDYSGRDTADVSVTNRDDDTPGVLLSVTSGLRTSEAGGMDTFTLRLLAPPTADVTITLASDTLAEATVSPASLTFTPTNWAALQTATVVGVDDATADGDQPFAVLTGPATSVDTRYSGFDADDVTGSNRDDETARILIEPLAGLSTTEGGGTAMFSVVLQSPPEADVMVSIASSDLSEGTVSDASVVFTAGDWNVARAIVATGVDDSVSDGDQTYSVVVGAATSADPFYSGRAGGSVVVTNVDDDAPGITIVRPAVQTTTELGGTHTFTVVLDSQPSASVILAVTSTDTSEGTVSVASRIFSTSNWNIPQTITVTGADDFLADGDQLYDVLLHVSLSADGDYATLADLRVSMTNIDDETAGIVVSPTTGLTTTESLGSTTFTIVLRSMPTAPVSIGLSSDMTSEGTVAPASITFTTGNWSVAQTVTVTGVNDLVVDGSRIYHIVTAAASSADATYNGIDPSDVTVANLDNDSVAITVSPLSISAPEGGVSGTFAIVLGSMPTASVTVPLHMLSTAQGVISPASVTFTTANWSTPQIAMVSAVNDGIVDGQFTNTAITDPAVSTDMSYGGLNGADVTVIHDDIPAIIVAPTSGLTTAEDGATAMFTVSLTAAPTANVVVPVSSSDATEGALVGGVSNVVFTAADWTPRTVTVAGVNDTLDDSDQPYSVVLGAATSSDARYNGLNPADVSLTNSMMILRALC
ncbi:MAG: hypothetical protein IPK60_11205 [Sandaracinaceae bacterium]|nr:hypothetical protein [Sandaracinaceae bacterium]